MNLNIFSDLRKSGLVPGKSLSLSIKIDSVKEKYSAYIMTNSMRSFHMKLATEYGRENVKIFQRWEKYERKMADFANHRRFTLRCLSKGLVPVSIRLTKNIKTPKGLQIVRRAERALMNERIRSINNTLNMVSNLRDTCKNQLRETLNDEWMDRCIEFIEVGREQQHIKTLERQKHKFERLLAREKVREGDRTTSLHGGHDGYHRDLTNQNNAIEPRTRRANNWVNNLSFTPLNRRGRESSIQRSQLCHST